MRSQAESCDAPDKDVPASNIALFWHLHKKTTKMVSTPGGGCWEDPLCCTQTFLRGVTDQEIGPHAGASEVLREVRKGAFHQCLVRLWEGMCFSTEGMTNNFAQDTPALQ